MQAELLLPRCRQHPGGGDRQAEKAEQEEDAIEEGCLFIGIVPFL